MSMQWTDDDYDEQVEDLVELRRILRRRAHEARQSGDSFLYAQCQRQLIEVQSEIERCMHPTALYRLTMDRRRAAKLQRWRRRGIRNGEPYTEEES